MLTEEELKQGQIDVCTLRLMNNGVLLTEVPIPFAKGPATIIRRMRQASGMPDCGCCICEYLITLPEGDEMLRTRIDRALGRGNGGYTFTVHASTWAVAFAGALQEAKHSLTRAISIAVGGQIKKGDDLK
jgi:hypothetical protein